MIDKRVRDDFIGLDKKIFFNNASYAPMLKPVKEKIDQYWNEIYNLRQPDEESMAYLQQVREESAKLIGADVDEIGFAFNTSHGIHLAALGLGLEPGDEVILADNDFPSVPYPFKAFESEGVVLKYAPSVNDNFSLDEARKLVTPRTKVLAVSFVQYFNGFRNDLRAIGEFCKERDIFFVVDAMQGLGNTPLNAYECHIDLLACGAQKWLLSPLGCGFFFISKQAKRQLKPLTTGWLGVDWHMKYSDLRHFDREPYDDARRFNMGTYPYMQIWAMAAALKYINNLGVADIFAHNLALIDRLLEYLQGNDYYYLKSSLEPKHRSSIISIGSPAGDQLWKYLLKENFYLVFREHGVRVAVNFYNTTDEIDVLIDRLHRFKASIQ
jgi:cysteine desulfurase / selenocysteine lyase